MYEMKVLVDDDDGISLRIAENAPWASESFARAAIDALAAHLAILDDKGTIIAVNRAWRDFARANSGGTDGLCEGVNYLAVCDAAAGRDADDAAAFAAGICAVMRGHRDQFALEYGCHAPTEKRWFIGRVTRVSGEGAARAVVVHENITARKQAEEELHRYALALESANKELEEFNQLAESATRAKSEFLANMSHEIRTPMTAILGYADILLKEEGLEHAPPHRRQAFAIIQRNGEHLLGLINDILDLSKVESGKMPIEPARCSPCELLTDLVALMRVRAEAKQLKLTAVVDGCLPETILADPLRLRQVLVNLVGNAIKFTDQGEVCVTARLAAENGPSRLHFDVTDTGIGMNAEQIGKLFQPFNQVDTSSSRRFGGTGLGLCISKRLTEAMGGTIEVRSSVGKGSTFSFTIDVGPLGGVPMIDGAQTVLVERVPVTATAPEKIQLHGRVLLAEDGPDNLTLIRTILEDAGADVTAVENGQLAVESVLAAGEAGAPFDVILMDMQMPVMDGYAATRELRARECVVPIIALTAHAMAEDRQKCLDAGCNDYTSKPIDWRKFLATVAAWMARVSADGPAVRGHFPVSVARQAEETLQSVFADKPVIARILPKFLSCLDARLQAMDAALAGGEWEELRRLAHQLKGAGGSYGFPSVSEAAKKLEYAARDRLSAAATASLAEVSALCRAAVRGLEARHDHYPAHAAALQNP
jgi:signal transduction histidine kinase/DNA-binding NarL/FixJ family response regulator